MYAKEIFSHQNLRQNTLPHFFPRQVWCLNFTPKTFDCAKRNLTPIFFHVQNFSICETFPENKIQRNPTCWTVPFWKSHALFFELKSTHSNLHSGIVGFMKGLNLGFRFCRVSIKFRFCHLDISKNRCTIRTYMYIVYVYRPMPNRALRMHRQ